MARVLTIFFLLAISSVNLLAYTERNPITNDTKDAAISGESYTIPGTNNPSGTNTQIGNMQTIGIKLRTDGNGDNRLTFLVNKGKKITAFKFAGYSNDDANIPLTCIYVDNKVYSSDPKYTFKRNEAPSKNLIDLNATESIIFEFDNTLVVKNKQIILYFEITFEDYIPISTIEILPVPELTYTYNALRQINMREYESTRHKMPLAKISYFDDAQNTKYHIALKIKKGDSNKVLNANAIGTDWIEKDENRITNNGYTLVADFQKLKEAIFDSHFEIIPNRNTDGACSDESHLHPGDIIEVTITASVTDASGEEFTDTESIPIRITDKYHIAYIVRGPVLGGFYDVDHTLPDLNDGYYGYLTEYYEVTPVNAWASFDTLNYKPFDLLVLTDYPEVGNNFEDENLNSLEVDKPHPYLVNQLAELVGMRPIFSWKSFFAKEANGESLMKKWTGKEATMRNLQGFKITGLPTQPGWDEFWGKDGDVIYTEDEIFNQLPKDENGKPKRLVDYDYDNNDPTGLLRAYMHLLTMEVVCDHSVFRRAQGLVKDNPDRYNIQVINRLSNDESEKKHVGLQGFTQKQVDASDDFIGIAEIALPNKTNGDEDWTDTERTLYTCVEWQAVPKARFMMFGVFKTAIEHLSDNGKEITRTAIEYLLDANPGHIEDCAYTFDNGYDYYYVHIDETLEQLSEKERIKKIERDFLTLFSENKLDYSQQDDNVIDAEMRKLDASVIYVTYYETADNDELVLRSAYRVRYERDDYADKFEKDKAAFLKAEQENPTGKDGKPRAYPFEAHDNKWRNKANWIQYNLPSENNNVRLRSIAKLDSATYEVNEVRINNMVASLHIMPTGGLKANGKFEQYDGARSYQDRRPISQRRDTLLQIHANEEHNGMLVHFHPNNNYGQLYATVDLYSPAHWDIDDKNYPDTKDDPIYGPITAYKYWTYFGMPITQAPIPDNFFGAYTFQWHEEKADQSDWIRMGDGTTLESFTYLTQNDSTLNGFALSQAKPKTFTLRGLLNNANKITAKLRYTTNHTTDKTEENKYLVADGANILGNPWTAPIHINQMKEQDFHGKADQTIYIYRTGRDPGWDGDNLSHTRPSSGKSNSSATEGYWFGIPIDACNEPEWKGLKVIPSMQAFLVFANSEADYIDLDYNKLVSEPISVENNTKDNIGDYWNDNTDNINTRTNNTARRIANNNTDNHMLRIIVSDTATIRDAYLVEGNNFSQAYDNGWEAYYMGSPNFGIWTNTSAGTMSVTALPDLNGTTLGFYTLQNAEYTISFSQWEGEELYLTDLKENITTRITEDATYTFTSSPNDQPTRFYLSRKQINANESLVEVQHENGKIWVSNPLNEKLTITLYDTAGRMLISKKTMTTYSDIDIPDNQGVYLIYIKGQITSLSTKVIR